MYYITSMNSIKNSLLSNIENNMIRFVQKKNKFYQNLTLKVKDLRLRIKNRQFIILRLITNHIIYITNNIIKIETIGGLS